MYIGLKRLENFCLNTAVYTTNPKTTKTRKKIKHRLQPTL